jgi:hypothetical protein
MQVFVPSTCIKESVKCLDNKRLGNQIYRECLTLARGKWPNHPVSKMWQFHTYFLCEYAFAGLTELQDRGKHYPNIFDKFHEIQMNVKDTGPPIWWGDMRVHESHQANLLRKDFEYYSQFGWTVQPSEYYYYPQNTDNEKLLLIKQRNIEKNIKV